MSMFRFRPSAEGPNAPDPHREELERLRRTFEALDAGLARVEYGPDGEILEANHRFLTLTGFSSDDLMGHALPFLAAPGDEENARAYWAALARGEPMRSRLRRRAADGRSLRLACTGLPVRDPAGGISRVVELVHDVSAEDEAPIRTERVRGPIEDTGSAGERPRAAAEVVRNLMQPA